MIKNKHRRWIIYLTSCLLFIFSQFYRSSIAVISPNLNEELTLNTEMLGLISAAFFYAFATMQIPVGIFLDSIGARLFMTILSLVAAMGAIVFAYGESVVVLIVGRILLGIGMACNLMGPLKLITAWFSPRYFATLSAIFISVGTAGNIAAATPLVWLTELFGWRTTFLFFAIINLIIAILFYLVARDRPIDLERIDSEPVASKTGHSKKNPPVRFADAMSGMVKLFTQRDYWLISLGTFFRYGIYASVQALWAGPLLITAMGLSPYMTGNLLLVMSIGLIIGSPICGWLSDRILQSRKPVVIAGLLIMAGILIVLSLLPKGIWMATLLVLFFTFGFSSSSGQIMYVHIKERMPHNRAGASMTGINFFTMTGVAFFLHGLGWAINEFFSQGVPDPEVYRTAFAIFGASLILTAFIYGLTVESKNGD